MVAGRWSLSFVCLAPVSLALPRHLSFEEEEPERLAYEASSDSFGTENRKENSGLRNPGPSIGFSSSKVPLF